MTSLSSEIQIWPDSVVICGHTVLRPARFSPAQWMEFWSQMADDRGNYDDGFEAGEEYGRREEQLNGAA